MHYADVSVDSHGGNKSVFTYLIPDHMPTVKVGQVVWVPFGKRKVHGIVVGLSSESRLENIRNIEDIIVEEPVVDSKKIDLAAWISSKYLSTDGHKVKIKNGFIQIRHILKIWR